MNDKPSHDWHAVSHRRALGTRGHWAAAAGQSKTKHGPRINTERNNFTLRGTRSAQRSWVFVQLILFTFLFRRYFCDKKTWRKPIKHTPITKNHSLGSDLLGMVVSTQSVTLFVFFAFVRFIIFLFVHPFHNIFVCDSLTHEPPNKLRPNTFTQTRA